MEIKSVKRYFNNSYHSIFLNQLVSLFRVFNEVWKYLIHTFQELLYYTVNSLLVDTSLKQTPRVGPYLSQGLK